jgi:hypothetical protein
VCWKSGVPVGAARIDLPDGTAQLCRCPMFALAQLFSMFVLLFRKKNHSDLIKTNTLAVLMRKGASTAGALMC